LAVWFSGNALALINVVALRQTRLVLGWVTVLYSSNEPGELSQWLCHDDSTINIVVVIIIIIISIYYVLPYFCICCCVLATSLINEYDGVLWYMLLNYIGGFTVCTVRALVNKSSVTPLRDSRFHHFHRL